MTFIVSSFVLADDDLSRSSCLFEHLNQAQAMQEAKLDLKMKPGEWVRSGDKLEWTKNEGLGFQQLDWRGMNERTRSGRPVEFGELSPFKQDRIRVVTSASGKNNYQIVGPPKNGRDGEASYDPLYTVTSEYLNNKLYLVVQHELDGELVNSYFPPGDELVGKLHLDDDGFFNRRHRGKPSVQMMKGWLESIISKKGLAEATTSTDSKSVIIKDENGEFKKVPLSSAIKECPAKKSIGGPSRESGCEWIEHSNFSYLTNLNPSWKMSVLRSYPSCGAGKGICTGYMICTESNGYKSIRRSTCGESNCKAARANECRWEKNFRSDYVDGQENHIEIRDLPKSTSRVRPR